MAGKKEVRLEEDWRRAYGSIQRQSPATDKLTKTVKNSFVEAMNYVCAR